MARGQDRSELVLVVVLLFDTGLYDQLTKGFFIVTKWR